MLYLPYLATHRSSSKDVAISQTWHQRPPSTAKRTKDTQGVSGLPISELIVKDVSQVVTSAEKQLVILHFDNQVFGFPVLVVQDIVEPLKITLARLPPSAVANVINLRGPIVNALDLRHCFGNLSYHEIDNQMGGTIEYHRDL